MNPVTATSAPRATARPWARHAIPLAMALACGLFVGLGDASTAAKVIAVAIFFAAATLWTNARELRLHAMINRHIALGHPEAILAIIEPELAYSRAARLRVPFTIYKAVARSLQGQWSDALAILDSIDISRMRGKARRTWQFLHDSHRFNCLLFNDRAAEARQLLEDRIEPFAEVVRSSGTRLIRDESRAKLAYFEGDRERARTAFEKLAHRGEIAPSSRAFYYYFLGRLAIEQGQPPGEHFDKARKLASETFLPAAIDEILADREPSQGPDSDAPG